MQAQGGGGGIHNSNPFATSTLEGVDGDRHAPAALPPGKGPGTHYKGGWASLGADLGGYGKSRPPAFDHRPASSSDFNKFLQIVGHISFTAFYTF
jgi:hypothetical protein